MLHRKTLRPGLARAESATPAAGPGERFARKCVVNNFGRSLRGTPGDSRMFAGLRRPRLRPARLKRAARYIDMRCKNHCSAPSASFLIAIAFRACCGLPQPRDGRVDQCRHALLLLGFLVLCFGQQCGEHAFLACVRTGLVGRRAPFVRTHRALRPSICTEVAAESERAGQPGTFLADTGFAPSSDTFRRFFHHFGQ